MTPLFQKLEKSIMADPNLSDSKFCEYFFKMIEKQHVTPEETYQLMSKVTQLGCTQLNSNNENIGSILISYNKNAGLNFSATKLFNILKKCDMNFIYNDQTTLGIRLATYNKDEELNLKPSQLVSLFKKSNLGIQDISGSDLACYIAFYNKKQNLNLTLEEYLSIQKDQPPAFIPASVSAGIFYFLNQDSTTLSLEEVNKLISLMDNKEAIRNELVEMSDYAEKFDAFVEKLTLQEDVTHHHKKSMMVL